MDIAILEGPETLRALEPEWNELLSRCAAPSPFLTHEWLAVSWRHYAARDRLLTVCFRDDGRLVGLVALRAQRSGGRRRLLFAVSQADCCDFVIERGAEWPVLEAFFRWLREEYADWHLVRLRGVCIRSATDHLVPVLATEAGLHCYGWRLETNPYVVLPATREQFHAQAPGQGRLRALLRKRRKLIRDHGELVVQITSGADLTVEAIGQLLHLHCRSWEGRGGSGVLPGTRAVRFHTEAAAALAPCGLSRIAWLIVGGRPVAGYYHFLTGRTGLAYISGYDPDFAPYSVGAQMALSLIEHGIDEGWDEVDLMRGAERYKFDFTRRCTYTMDHAIARTRRQLRLFTAFSALRGRLPG